MDEDTNSSTGKKRILVFSGLLETINKSIFKQAISFATDGTFISIWAVGHNGQ